ncbi:alpha/beta hydrolase [Virgibacillus xinjiangensis]|uniref:Alpha/beta hydrolase n=1 Tax=Virgibacillus xinjiangensis TaxID=393090 RepID=A0ABV7CWQ3_9BACI
MEGTFHYDVKTPQSVRADRTYPLLIALHGIGYDEKDMMEAFDGVTDEYILVAPRGNLTYEEGFAYYYLEDYGKPDMALFDASMEKLQVFIDEVMEEYPVDRDQVYLAGFSQGAILSNSLAMVLGDCVRGIVSMNGYVPGFLKDRYPVQPVGHLNVWLSTGEDDEIFSPEIGRKNEAFFRAEGASVRYRTYLIGHELGEAAIKDAVQWLLADIKQVNK